MRRFRVPHLPASGELLLDAEASHHLLRVIRLSSGERVELFDGSGHAAMAELLGVQDERAHMALLESPRRVRPEGDVYLLIGIPKGQAMDLAVRMATEAGATVIQPVLSQRCIARGDRLDRWQRIAGSAAQQCGRAELPDIRELCPLREGMRALPDGIQKYVALPGSTQTVSPHQGAAILIGPEGGLTEQEADRALQEGWTPISLGPWVLRAETAAAVGVAALVNQLETTDAD